jgi:hypothetical protein
LSTTGFVVLVALAASACEGEGGTVEEDVDKHGVQQPVSLHGTRPPNEYGPSPSQISGNYEYAMTQGRLSKLPLSYVWAGRFSEVGPGAGQCVTVEVRARCEDSAAAQDECDPGLYVARESLGWFSNERLAGRYVNDMAGSREPIVDFQLCGDNVIHAYTVFAYSELRGTSYVTIEHRVGGGAWTSAFYNLDDYASNTGLWRHVGGALVKVGPVASGDKLEVRSPGTCQVHPLMVVFPENMGDHAYSNPTSTTECDPSFTASGSAWTGQDIYAIVGLDGLTAASTKQVAGRTYNHYERNVDLVHAGTLRTGSVALGACASPTDHSDPDCLGASSVSLNPGKYTFSVTANATGKAVGDSPDWDGNAYNGDDTGYTCNGNSRGVGNDLAFKMVLKQDGVIVRQRYVPRGLLGGNASTFSQVTIDHTVPAGGPHSYKVELHDVGRSIRFENTWRYRNLRDAVELKIATANIEYGDGMQTDNELRNVVDLLGRSADHGYSGKPRVAYERNRGRWRWDADIINLNEIMDTGTRYTAMLNRLNSHTPLAWQGVRHLQKTDGTDREGPVFLNERAASSQRVDLGASDIGGSFFTPIAGAAARRPTVSGTYDERPIVLYNTYFQHDADGGDGIGDRESQYEELIANIATYHLRDYPFSFNTAGSSSPTAPGNRFILIGDMNMRNHQCAESNRLVRKLRETFGYALDVSMAITDAQDRTDLDIPGVQHRTFDTHYSGASLTRPNTGQYFTCSSETGVHTTQPSTRRACPYLWETTQYWAANGRNRSVTGQYQWWAGPGSNYGGGSSRLDAVILVGRGWASDDPVREYAVVQSYPTPTPLVPEANGVEIRNFCATGNADEHEERLCVGDPDCAMTSGNYSPEFQVCSGEEMGAGHTAFRSDHKPVGVRLRVFMD